MYYRFEGLILAGDVAQLSPICIARNEDGSPLAQNRCSLMARLLLFGFKATTLNEQYRMSPDLAVLPNHLGYNGKILDAPSSDRKNTPLGIKVTRINQIKFQHAAQEIFFDVVKGRTEACAIDDPNLAEKRKSARNRLNFQVGMRTLETLLLAGVKASEIVILAPFSAQCDLYNNALRKFRTTRPDLSLDGLEFSKAIDAYQECEKEIVILDMVVTNDFAWVGNWNRWNLATSRARTARYIIGSATKWEQSNDLQQQVDNSGVQRIPTVLDALGHLKKRMFTIDEDNY